MVEKNDEKQYHFDKKLNELFRANKFEINRSIPLSLQFNPLTIIMENTTNIR